MKNGCVGPYYPVGQLGCGWVEGWHEDHCKNKDKDDEVA